MYNTGEKPVLVDCSDYKARVCKYSRSSGSKFKLACEIIGSSLAEAWQLNIPKCDLVKIKPCHVPAGLPLNWFEKPCVGSVLIDKVVDINPNSIANVATTAENLTSLLKIALFDFWIANEDRNANNANLMYDVENRIIVPIDFGCIFNSTTFDFPLAQLTSTDTILYSDLFGHMSKRIKCKKNISSIKDRLYDYYKNSLQKSKDDAQNIINNLPSDWNINHDIIENKLAELHQNQWIDDAWNNFTENLDSNLRDEQHEI